MSSRDLSLGLRLYADSARFVSGLTQAEGRTRRFVGGVKREFDSLKGVLSSVQGHLAALGIGIGTTAAIIKSAALDKELQYLKNTSGASREEIAGLRKEFFELQKQTGQSVDTLRTGVDALIAGGASVGQARASIIAMADTLATASGNAADLAKAVGLVGQRFDVDLNNIDAVRLALDKMKVAGQEGYAELNNLPALFSTVGGAAKAAGLDFDQTLAFIETLSLVQPNAERLSTLVESTLRVFTVKDYRDKAEKATGVLFNDKNGKNRDPIQVLREMQEKFKRFKTDAKQLKALDMAFGGADKDTIEGLRSLLTGTLDKYDPIAEKIKNASGSTAKDINESINNASVAAERLRGALGSAADEFATPINEIFTKMVSYGLDKKEKGGLGLEGNDILVGGAVGALGIFGAARYGGKAIGALAKRLGGTATGVAEGKALQELAGVTPVFVVNWPTAIGGSVVDFAGAAGGGSVAKNAGKVAGRAKTLAVLAGGLPLSAWGTTAAGFGTAAAGVTAAGLAGYGIGRAFDVSGRVDRWIQRKSGGLTDGTEVIGGSIARILAAFGNEEARRAIEVTEKLKQTEIKGKVSIEVNEGRISSVRASSNNANIQMDLSAGMTMMD